MTAALTTALVRSVIAARQESVDELELYEALATAASDLRVAAETVYSFGLHGVAMADAEVACHRALVALTKARSDR